VVCALLRWIYCEQVVSQDPDEWAGSDGVPRDAVGPRAVRLGRRWGLRDAECLQGRVAARRVVTRGSGTLAKDLLRAYDAGALDANLTFRAADGDEALPGGWADLLRQRSPYFGAMLGGDWAEGRNGGEITVHWPHDQMVRLLRFLHGAPFVRGQDDLHVALGCAKFFGVPALFAEVNEWISGNLSLRNAPALWNLVESEPLLRHHYGVAQEDVADADGACFDFHVAHFAELVKGERHMGEEPEIEIFEAKAGFLHELCAPLMQRLLSSGLVDVPSASLTPVVLAYAEGRTKGRPMEEYRELCEMLRPPAVLFNREHRAKLLPAVQITARSFLG